jgi:dsRNA-specific ribonuclease
MFGTNKERYFSVEALADGKRFGPSLGKSKKKAEQGAARLALDGLKG